MRRNAEGGNDGEEEEQLSPCSSGVPRHRVCTNRALPMLQKELYFHTNANSPKRV